MRSICNDECLPCIFITINMIKKNFDSEAGFGDVAVFKRTNSENVHVTGNVYVSRARENVYVVRTIWFYLITMNPPTNDY